MDKRILGVPAAFQSTIDRLADAAVARPLAEDVEREFARRAYTVREAMRQADVAVLISAKPSTIEWVSGFSTSAVGKVVLAITETDVRLRTAASELGRAVESPGISIVDAADWDGPLRIREWYTTLGREHSGNFGIALADRQTPFELVEELRHLDAVVTDVTHLVENLRLKPSDFELEKMRTAATVTASALEEAIVAARVDGITDAVVAGALIDALARHGNSLARGDVIVGVDEGGGLPHSPWCGRSIERDSVIFLEFSGSCDRYCSPVMRTLVKEDVDARVVELHNHAEQMLSMTIEQMVPGARCSDIAAAGMRVLDGMPDVLFHGNFGYPVSLSDQQSWMNGAPFYVVQDNDAVLEEGMVFHIPIALRYFGRFAVGASHTVRVADPPEILTSPVRSGLIRV